jgi:hypothetical protein
MHPAHLDGGSEGTEEQSGIGLPLRIMCEAAPEGVIFTCQQVTHRGAPVVRTQNAECA